MAVGTATELQDGWLSWARIQLRARVIFLHIVQIGSVAHSGYLMRKGVPSQAYGGKGAKLTTHPPPVPSLRISGTIPLLRV